MIEPGCHEIERGCVGGPHIAGREQGCTYCEGDLLRLKRAEQRTTWRVDLGFTAATPDELMEFSAKIFPIAKASGIGWEGGPCTPSSAAVRPTTQRVQMVGPDPSPPPPVDELDF